MVPFALKNVFRPFFTAVRSSRIIHMELRFMKIKLRFLDLSKVKI
jgi:hypothetical protein